MDQDTLLPTMIVYCEAFDERDALRRLDLLRRSMTPTAEIWGPKRPLRRIQRKSRRRSMAFTKIGQVVGLGLPLASTHS